MSVEEIFRACVPCDGLRLHKHNGRGSYACVDCGAKRGKDGETRQPVKETKETTMPNEVLDQMRKIIREEMKAIMPTPEQCVAVVRESMMALLTDKVGKPAKAKGTRKCGKCKEPGHRADSCNKK